MLSTSKHQNAVTWSISTCLRFLISAESVFLPNSTKRLEDFKTELQTLSIELQKHKDNVEQLDRQITLFSQEDLGRQSFIDIDGIVRQNELELVPLSSSVHITGRINEMERQITERNLETEKEEITQIHLKKLNEKYLDLLTRMKPIKKYYAQEIESWSQVYNAYLTLENVDNSTDRDI